jgi:hypothetical protein
VNHILVGKQMRILTYKRTHTGDPNPKGQFGIFDCMGRVRNYSFDAVIGVGGIGREPRSFGIDRRINWVGISPSRRSIPGTNKTVVTFEKFLLLDEQGPLLEDLAPHLAKRMYQGSARLLLDAYSNEERSEAEAILRWSTNQKQVKVKGSKVTSGCRKRCRSLCS